MVEKRTRLPPLQRELAEVLGQGRFAEPRRAAEQDVVPGIDEVERDETFHEVTVDGRRPVPLEAVEGLHGAERGVSRAALEISAGALLGFGVDEEFEDLGRRELALVHVVDDRAQRFFAKANADAVQQVGDVSLLGHRSLRGRVE